MAKKMVKLPKGTVLYAGDGKYVGEAPEVLWEAHLAGVEKAKAKAGAKAPKKAKK